MSQGIEKIPHRIPAQWDPVWFERFIREVLAKADIRNAIGDGIDISGQSSDVATLAISQDIQDLLQQTYVLASASGFLQFERVLAGETGVVTITDGGPNGNITVEITANGINLGKLQQLGNVGILGNPSTVPGNVTNIIPDNDGDALAVASGAIAWTPTPTWGGSHKWPDSVQLILGTGDDFTLEFDGTDGTMDVAGGLVVVATGDYEVAALTYKVTTDGTERLEIDADGAWLVASDAGAAGEVLTSNGTGAPPTWETPSGGTVRLEKVQINDLAITSNNVLQDTDLVIALTSGTWLITLDLCHTSNSTPQMETSITYTGTTTSVAAIETRLRAAAAFAVTTFTALPIARTETTSDTQMRRLSIRLTVSTSGNFKVQARQINSGATAVTFRAGSNVQAVKIS